jgi:hypothetical protein
MRWSHRKGKGKVVCQGKSRQLRMEEVDKRGGKVGESEKGGVSSVGNQCRDWRRRREEEACRLEKREE